MGTKYAWVRRTQPVTRVASRGSVCACRSDLCIKHRDNYIREHGKLPQGEGIYLRQAKS